MLLVLACAPPPSATTEAPPRSTPTPPPTEHWLDDDAEERQHRARDAWFERMHRAPPGVDWREIEDRNGQAQIERRNRLPPPAATRWTERGSNNQAGSTFVARWGRTDDQLYLGSALGGVWRGGREGTDFVPLGDNLYGGVNWLEVFPGEGDAPDILFVGTDGGSFHRSTDAGATWTVPTGLETANWARRVLQSSDGEDVLYVVATTSLGTFLHRSRDAGATFEPLLDLGLYGDAWAPRDGQPGVYAATSTGLRYSDDEGETWTLQGELPESASYVDLAGSEAGGPTFYAVTDSARLWRSDDAGATWGYLTRVNDYWAALNASILDPDLFVYGGVDLKKTTDGGASFVYVNEWWEYYGQEMTKLHADMMGVDVWLDEAGNEVWHINNHGGTYRSVDGMLSVQNLSLEGLRVSQYYDVLTSTANPEHVAAGAQDQGYQLTNDAKQDGGIYEFDQVLSGDYGHLTSSDGTHEYVYSVYPGFILAQVGEDDPVLAYASFPSGEAYVPWLPPIVADPTQKRAFFFPATRIYRYEAPPRQNSWAPELYSKHNFGQYGDGDYVSRLTFSPVDTNRAYAVTANGRAWYSADRGLTWTQSESLIADDNWYYGQAIAPSLLDADTLTVGGSGYGVPAVYRSTDGGVSFAPWHQGLPDTLVYTLVEVPDGLGTVFAGTQTGAYMRRPGDAAWTDITDHVSPITTYWDAEVLLHEPVVRFATYGRGIFDYRFEVEGCYPVVDGDGDGVLCSTDCDDANAAILPGAAEACDGVDANCEADLDESDADGDGFLACAECDDDEASAFPGGEERCGDGIDQDCDGRDVPCEADEGDPIEIKPGCGCGSGAPVSAGLLLLAALFVRRSR